MNNKKVKFEFKDRAAIGPNVMRFTTTEKENSILSFFNEAPSRKMLEFLNNMGSVIKLKGSPTTGEWIYEVEADLKEIQEILAFSDWGIKEIYEKSIFPDQTRGIFCLLRNEITAAYLKATGQKALEAGIARFEEGYRLMTKQDFIDGIDTLWEEQFRLKKRLEEIPRERERLANTYANLHLPEIDLTIGQKTIVENPFTGEKVTAWFAGAKASTIHADGNLTLQFHPAKKDGTPSKIIDTTLNQTFTIKDKSR